jgi:hypothetical protein
LKRIAITVLALVLLVAAGAATFSVIAPLAFSDRKREFRLFFGLPKNWSNGFNADTAANEALACPGPEAIVIITGGQSNAANAFSDPVGPDPASRAYMMLDGQCYRLRDPVLGATGQDGSLWTGLGLAIHAQTGRPVVFINGAVGGAQLGDWLDDRSHYRQRLADQSKMARRIGLTPDYVMWIQGETDAAVLLAPSLYVAQMRDVIARFDASGAVPPGTPWVIYRSTRCKDRRGNGPDIDRAIAVWATGSNRIILGPLASALDDDYRRDGCHFNGRGRQALIAETMAIIGPRLMAR